MNSEQRKFRRIIKRRRKVAAKLRVKREQDLKEQRKRAHEKALWKIDRKKAAEHNVGVERLRIKQEREKRSITITPRRQHRSINHGS